MFFDDVQAVIIIFEIIKIFHLTLNIFPDMKDFKFPTLTIIFFLIINASSGQDLKHSQKAIDASLLKEDFLLFKNSLSIIHPSIFRYNNKHTIEKLFDSCYSSINKSETAIEFYGKILFLSSSIQDGHLGSYVSEKSTNYFINHALSFPMHLRFIKDRAFVLYSKAKILPRETEILAINDKPIDQIQKELFQYLRSDGAIKSFKCLDLSENFSLYYFTVYGQQSDFRISYKERNGTANTITVKADYYKNYDKKTLFKDKTFILTYIYKKNLSEDMSFNLSFKNNDSLAIIKINSFSNTAIPVFLAKSFKELKDKKTGKLIIDLRGNLGGYDTYGSLLYSYLTNKEFRYYSSLETSIRKLTGADHPNLLMQNPSINNFDGQLFILIDGGSFSATAEFCSVAKSSKRGLFIGEETGGGYYGNTSGDDVEIVLPNSKITIGIPTTKYTMAVEEIEYKDRGIFPDYEIIPNINDIVQNKDIQMDFALKLAKQK